MDPHIDDETFRGQVHHDQHTIHFRPEPGDIIVRKVVDHENVSQDHYGNCMLSIYGLVELYKDNFYAYPERCPDPTKRAAYHRMFFRNGDHVIRRGRFKREDNYEYRDEEFISVWVYWPGYQLHSTFVRLISACWNVNGAQFCEFQPGRYRCRAQSYLFQRSEINWEPGDLVLRYFRPGPPGAPNPGWYRLLGVQQVDALSDMSYAEEGDLLIKQKGRPEAPKNPGKPVRVNTRMEMYCYVLTRYDRHAEDETPETKAEGFRWMYLCGDSMLYDFNDWDSIMRLPTVDDVPQPADIMISHNQEFTKFDEETELGGYVKFYQNAATSVDPREPKTITFHPTRVPENGATTAAAAPPNLPRPELQAGWLEPNWDHLSVPVQEAAHPIVFRFGRWAEESSSAPAEPVYRWIWNPHIEIYQRHPRSVDGRTFFLADRTEVNYGEGIDYPTWEEFVDYSTPLHQREAMDDFPVLHGDCIIRRDLRHNVHPILTHSLMPATNAEGDLACCPGDLLLRYGLINEDEAHQQEVAAAGNRYHFGVELYVLIVDSNLEPLWQFRGRDQVIFGFVPRPKEKKVKLAPDQGRLMGMHDGSKYYYSAPGSQTTRSALLAVEGGPRGVQAKRAELDAREEKRMKKQEEEELWKRKTQDPTQIPNDDKKSKKASQAEMDSLLPGSPSLSLESESGTNKENKKWDRKKIKVIEATRPKLRHEVIFPTFPNHETGNYRRDFQGHH